MGNHSTKEEQSVSLETIFSPQEIDALKHTCDPNNTRFQAAFTLLAQKWNASSTIMAWALIAKHIAHTSTMDDKNLFISAYKNTMPSASNEQLFSSFFSTLASIMHLYRHSSKLQHPPNDKYPSDAFLHFLIAKCSSKNNANDDLDFLLSADASSSSKKKQIFIPEFTAFHDWFGQNIYAQRLWHQAFHKLFFDLGPTDKEAIPAKIDVLPVGLVGPKSDILTMEDLFILDTSISKPLRAKSFRWTCLFSSRMNGNSWTVFQTAIENAGSLLIVVRDKAGHVFGAFSATELAPNSKFVGSPDNFLFKLGPEKEIYPSTGLNSNYQYFNYRTNTFPNGLGFGGQFDYFGLWIDDSFEKGHSKGSPVSTTFGNPPLTSSEEFLIDHVEVWCVNPKEVDDRYVDPKQSALEANPEAMELLEMAGKKMWSKTVQDQKDINFDDDE